MRFLLLLFLLLSLLYPTHSTGATDPEEYVPGELILGLEPGYTVQTLALLVCHA